MTKLILKLFFLLPSWLLKVVTMRKKILVNGQILDYQTQILLALQSLQPDNFDLTESAADLRIKLDGRKDSLPNIKLSGSQVTFRDHTIYANNIELTEQGKKNPFYKDKETNFKQVFEMVEQHSKKYIKAAFL